MNIDQRVPLWEFESLRRQSGIRHFVSTRDGGVSPEPYATLNLSISTGDERQNVVENRNRLAAGVGISPDQIVSCRQVHQNQVRVVQAGERGIVGEADGLTTAAPGLMLMVLAADCAPLLLYDPARGAVAAVHAGWRGTVAEIAIRAIESMQTAFGCRPEEIRVGIGPSIGPCCYEVGPDVIKEVEQSIGDECLLPHSLPGKAFFDLRSANVRQLIGAGVRADRIETAGICTKCSSNSFYSDRARRPNGRFAAGIMLLRQ